MTMNNNMMNNNGMNNDMMKMNMMNMMMNNNMMNNNMMNNNMMNNNGMNNNMMDMMMNNNMMNNNMMNMNMMNNNMMNNNMMNNNMMNMNMMNNNIMNNMMNNNVNVNKTLTRLNLEYNLCSKDPELKGIGCIFKLINNDIFNWKVSLKGPTGTPYEGGKFNIHIIFPRDYPKYGPEFKFMNKICHLNVDWRSITDEGGPGDGHICLSTLNEWNSTGKVVDKKGYGVKQAIFDIFCLFHNQGTESPYYPGLANLYMTNPKAFNDKAKRWTNRYAS